MFRENRIKKHDSKQEHMSVARFLEFKYIKKQPYKGVDNNNDTIETIFRPLLSGYMDTPNDAFPSHGVHQVYISVWIFPDRNVWFVLVVAKCGCSRKRQKNIKYHLWYSGSLIYGTTWLTLPKIQHGTWKWSPERGDSFSETIIFRFHVCSQACTCYWAALLNQKQSKNEYSCNASVLKGDDLLTSPFLTLRDLLPHGLYLWSHLLHPSIVKGTFFLSNTKSLDLVPK